MQEENSAECTHRAEIKRGSRHILNDNAEKKTGLLTSLSLLLITIVEVFKFAVATYFQPKVDMSVRQSLGSLMHYKCSSQRSLLLHW